MRAGGSRPDGVGLTGRPGPGGPRLFVAVDPPEAARANLAQAVAALHDAPGGPRWGDPARWHVTLLFLGTVPHGRVPALLDALPPVVAATAAMVLRLAGGGRFGSVRRPQVAWVRLEGDLPELAGLAGRLAGAARGLGLPVEDRPFRPHLTVGRWRPGRPADGSLVDRLAGYRGPDWPVRDVRLVQSTAGPEPRHELVAGWDVTG